MSRWIEYSDDELQQAAAGGDCYAEELLVKKYNRLVKACARPFFLAGGDSEDLIQEGMLGLLNAIRQYRPGEEASFKTYAEQCIRNRLYTAIKSASRSKHAPLNDSVSFESPQFDESKTVASCYLCDPEELVIIREHLEEIRKNIGGQLSKLESKVLDLYLEGYSYDEIAYAVSKTPKSVDNAVQRIRKKLAQFL